MNFKRFGKTIITIVLVPLNIAVHGQQVLEVQFGDALKRMPTLALTLDETVKQWEDAEKISAALSAMQREFLQNQMFIYEPLYREFLDRLAGNDQLYVTQIEAGERKMYDRIKSFARGLENELTATSFLYALEMRPPIQQLSWGKIKAPLTATGQALYQELLQIERNIVAIQLNRDMIQKELFEKSLPTEAKRLPRFGDADKRVEVLVKKRWDELKALPKKKVMFAEGAVMDMEEPSKALAIYRHYQQKEQEIHRANFLKTYQWWQEKWSRIRSTSKHFDSLLQQINFGKELHGADEQLVPVLADVQARLWFTLDILGSAISLISTDSFVTQVSQLQYEEMMQWYQKGQDYLEKR